MRSLPLGPEDAFVLSRVDGTSNENDIAAATGLDVERVKVCLARLAELGAVAYDTLPSVPPQRPPERPSGSPSMRLDRPVVESRPDGPAPSALYDPSELDEEVDLDLPRRRKIVDYFYRLEGADHYTMLDVTRNADRKQIKTAYFAIVGQFHPDTYYGKRLGSFKAKLEKVFSRLTEAHDVLSRKPLRDAYDTYLESQERTQKLERAMSQGDVREEELEEARRRIEHEARLAERQENVPSRGSVMPPADPDARRKMLARKLRGGGGSMPAPRESRPPGSTREVQEHVAEDLRRRYESRVVDARETHVARYREAAETAIKNNDLVSAANSLRIATSLAPEDEGLRARLEEIQQKANTTLAETYLDQAKYEEQSKRFLEAAVSYERALRGKPTAIIYERAAFCLLEGNGDLKRAGDHARKAVSLAPKAAEPRLTLAKIYLQAGMKESALVEFERASQLAPHDASIKDWVRRIKRGEV
jgi:tetratricopeptide (TPR) repeat protein